MKRTLWIFLLGALWAAPARATDFTNIFSSGFANGTNVPDGSLSGWSDTRTLGGFDGAIANVSVVLGLRGGFNGDEYAYLTHGSGFAVLLNRPGVASTNGLGYSNTGLNVLLSDGSADVHFYQTVSFTLNPDGQLTGTWAPDGRGISPLSSGLNFDAPGTLPLAGFNGIDPSGDWTLFIADVSGGGGALSLDNWGLQVTTVPEPGAVWLGLSAVAILGVMRWKHRAGRRGGHL